MQKSTPRPGGAIAAVGGLTVMIAAALAACGREDASLYAERSTVAAIPAAPADAPPAWIGRWARAPTECAERAFVFSPNRLEAPAGSWCDVSDWQTSSAGYSMSTVCHIRGGGPTPGRLLVTVPNGSAGQTLTVEGGPLEEPLGLVRCPTAEAQAPSGAAG